MLQHTTNQNNSVTLTCSLIRKSCQGLIWVISLVSCKRFFVFEKLFDSEFLFYRAF